MAKTQDVTVPSRNKLPFTILNIPECQARQWLSCRKMHPPRYAYAADHEHFCTGGWLSRSRKLQEGLGSRIENASAQQTRYCLQQNLLLNLLVQITFLILLQTSNYLPALLNRSLPPSLRGQVTSRTKRESRTVSNNFPLSLLVDQGRRTT